MSTSLRFFHYESLSLWQQAINSFPVFIKIWLWMKLTPTHPTHKHIHSHLITLYFHRQATLHSIVSVFNFKTVPTNSCEQTRLSKCVSVCVSFCVCVCVLWAERTGVKRPLRRQKPNSLQHCDLGNAELSKHTHADTHSEMANCLACLGFGVRIKQENRYDFSPQKLVAHFSRKPHSQSRI